MPPKTRCKFVCESITVNRYNPAAKTVKFHAVYGAGADPENVSFAQATPSGNLEIQVTNPDVLPMFTLGQEFYLDLIPVPAPVPAPPEPAPV